MENASKALLIAGGILIAMLLLSLLIYAITAMGDLADSQDTKLAAEQLKEFNNTYLAYNKTRMYGTDVITVVNKANENNIKYEDNPSYHIEIKILDSASGEISISYEKEFKNLIFRCSNVEYNDEGRIRSMTFTQI